MNEWIRFFKFLGACVLLVVIAAALAFMVIWGLSVPDAHGADFRLTDFSGGVANVSRFNLAANQVWRADNLLLANSTLEARKGYSTLHQLSDNPITFLDVFHKKAGQNYLMISDGVTLWYSPELVQTPITLGFGRSNLGVVDTWGTYVSGDSLLVQKWLTLFGAGDGMAITINGVEYTIDHFVTDTSLILTSSAGSQSNVTYNIDYQALRISGGLAMSDNYWFFTTAGTFFFHDIDSFTVADSITGTRYQTTDNTRLCQFFPVLNMTTSGLEGDHSGEFLQLTTNPLSAGGTKNAVTGGQPFYMSYPVMGNNASYLNLFGAAFQPDSTTTQYFAVRPLVYDSTTLITVNCDSVRLLASDSANFSCNGGEALYLAIYDASLTASSFKTNDWFCVPRSAWSDYENSYTGTEHVPTAAADVFPVVGGFQAASGAIYAACPPTQFSRNNWTIAGNNKSFAFYRMKTTAPVDTSTIESVAEYDNRVFKARKQTVTYSELYDPGTDIIDDIIITDPSGENITAMLRQGDRLRVYTANNRYAITTPDGYTYLVNKIGSGIGCVAQKTLAEKDGVHYYLHSSGVFRDDGGADLGAPLSQNVNSWFVDSLDYTRYERCTAAIYENRYWICIPMKSGGFKTLICDLRTGAWTTSSNFEFASAKIFNGTVDTLRFIFGDADSGIVNTYGGLTDRGATITATLQTPWYDFAPGMLESYNEIYWSWQKRSGTGFTLSLLPSYMTTAHWSISLTPTSTFGYQRLNPAMAFGDNLSLILSITDAAQFKLGEIEVIYDAKSSSR